MQKWRILYNRYFLATAVFVIWVVFLDQNNLITQYLYYKELKKAEEEMNYYKQELEKVKIEMDQLTSDPAKLEKFARERYFMKRPEEDIFIIFNTDKQMVEDEF